MGYRVQNRLPARSKLLTTAKVWHLSLSEVSKLSLGVRRSGD